MDLEGMGLRPSDSAVNHAPFTGKPLKVQVSSNTLNIYFFRTISTIYFGCPIGNVCYCSPL